jgi:hypothetical protein
MSARNDRLKRATQDLQKMLKELEPYIHRPTVVEPTTRGRWVRNEGGSFGKDGLYPPGKTTRLATN